MSEWVSVAKYPITGIYFKFLKKIPRWSRGFESIVTLLSFVCLSFWFLRKKKSEKCLRVCTTCRSAHLKVCQAQAPQWMTRIRNKKVSVICGQLINTLSLLRLSCSSRTRPFDYVFWVEMKRRCFYCFRWMSTKVSTLEYLRGSGRPGSNEVIHVKLRKRKSARFQLFSSFIFLCD